MECGFTILAASNAAAPPSPPALTDLFTIISIVIAVSGSTYAGLVAVREFFGGKVTKWLSSCDEYAKSASDSTKTASAKNNIATCYFCVRWCRWMWNTAFIVPILGFVVISYAGAIHILWEYHRTSIVQTESWPLYRRVLWGLVIVDGACLGLIFALLVAIGVLHWIIRAFYQNLFERTDLSPEDKSHREESSAADL